MDLLLNPIILSDKRIVDRTSYSFPRTYIYRQVYRNLACEANIKSAQYSIRN